MKRHEKHNISGEVGFHGHLEQTVDRVREALRDSSLGAFCVSERAEGVNLFVHSRLREDQRQGKIRRGQGSLSPGFTRLSILPDNVLTAFE